MWAHNCVLILTILQLIFYSVLILLASIFIYRAFLIKFSTDHSTLNCSKRVTRFPSSPLPSRSREESYEAFPGC